MQRRHFELIARIIKESRPSLNLTAGQQAGLAEDFAMELSELNPRFDMARFKKACGVKEAPVRKEGPKLPVPSLQPTEEIPYGDGYGSDD